MSETARSGVAATRRVDRSRQAVPRETRAGGWAYLFTDERAGDDDGDVHARALRGGVEARDGAVAVRLDRGRAGVFCRWSRARSVEAPASDPGGREAARTDIAVL